MTLVRSIISKKNTPIWSVTSQATVKEALRLMADQHIGAVVVVDGGYLVGLFSERDYARHAVSIQDFSLDLRIDLLMTCQVYVVTPDDTLDDCMAIMTKKNIRHLPVLDEGILVGMISVGDVVKTTLAEMDSRINELENYLWIHMI